MHEHGNMVVDVYLCTWVAWCIWELTSKIELRSYIYIYDILKNILLKFCFLALYVKLLIDINCVCIIDKTFYNYWCDRLIVVTKKVILVVKLDEN